jgi:hypothetical protein
MKFGTIASLTAGAMLATSPLPALAQDKTQVFEPSGPWALDYGDDYCRLARTFSDGSDELALAFERIQPGPFMRMVLVSDGIKMYRRASTIGWRFTPTDAGRESPYTKSQTADGKQYFNLGPVMLAPMAPPAPGAPPAPPPPYDPAQEQATAKALTGFVLEGGLTSPVQVETEALDAPIGALQACADDLLKTWGLDPVKHGVGYTPAIPESGGVGWLPTGTIPFTDFGKLAGGSNQVRLMVDASGKPSACHIHWPTLGQSLNDRICKTLLDKGKFQPAKDPGGQAMASYWVGDPMFLGPPPPGGRRPG